MIKITLCQSDFNKLQHKTFFNQGNTENWKYGDMKSGRFSEVEMTPIIKNGQSKGGKVYIMEINCQ